MSKQIETDELCELSSDITQNIASMFNLPLEYTAENGDTTYYDKAQDIFNMTFDILDNGINGDEL